MNISNIMKKNVETIQTNESARKAGDVMYRLGIRHLPVMKGKNLVGMISDRDLSLAAFFTKDDEKLKNIRSDILAQDIMTSNPIILSPLDSVQKTMEIAIEKKVGAFPVMDQHQLVGIVSVIDLLEVGLKALQGKV